MKSMQKNNFKKSISEARKGFTLVELMIVIAIIGILTVFFINTSTINLKRGRDSRRQSDLELIRSGIETFRADCNSYPLTLTFGSSLKGDGTTVNCANTNTYITIVPKDPIASQSYLYYSDGTVYQVCAGLEAPPSGTTTKTCGGSSVCGAVSCNYQVLNP